MNATTTLTDAELKEMRKEYRALVARERRGELGGAELARYIDIMGIQAQMLANETQKVAHIALYPDGTLGAMEHATIALRSRMGQAPVVILQTFAPQSMRGCSAARRSFRNLDAS